MTVPAGCSRRGVQGGAGVSSRTIPQGEECRRDPSREQPAGYGPAARAVEEKGVGPSRAGCSRRKVKQEETEDDWEVLELRSSVAGATKGHDPEARVCDADEKIARRLTARPTATTEEEEEEKGAMTASAAEAEQKLVRYIGGAWRDEFGKFVPRELVEKKGLTWRREQSSTGSRRMEQEEVPIFVKTLRGKTIIGYVEASANLSCVKEKIEEKEGIPPRMQSLVFAGRQLRDEESLAQHRVRKDSTIWLTLRLVGGIVSSKEERGQEVGDAATSTAGQPDEDGGAAAQQPHGAVSKDTVWEIAAQQHSNSSFCPGRTTAAVAAAQEGQSHQQQQRHHGRSNSQKQRPLCIC